MQCFKMHTSLPPSSKWNQACIHNGSGSIPSFEHFRFSLQEVLTEYGGQDTFLTGLKYILLNYNLSDLNVITKGASTYLNGLGFIDQELEKHSVKKRTRKYLTIICRPVGTISANAKSIRKCCDYHNIPIP
ncbi:hypothetical protein H8356DRAFT_1425825 [Neocallimastix lanati (nom. inval.)]|nr:hypothetical protein H8356DRAFT_1425825 [Neocallimastix sp. JGI-2020a]